MSLRGLRIAGGKPDHRQVTDGTRRGFTCNSNARSLRVRRDHWTGTDGKRVTGGWESAGRSYSQCVRLALDFNASSNVGGDTLIREARRHPVVAIRCGCSCGDGYGYAAG